MGSEEESNKRVKGKIHLADDLPTPPVNPVYFAMQIVMMGMESLLKMENRKKLEILWK